MAESVLAPVRPIFRALAETILPDAARLDERAWADVESIIEQALAERPPAMQRQLVLLIRTLHWLPVARWGRPFPALDPARRTRFLESVQRAPMKLLRRGFWGLRTLVLMGYYARPAAAAEIGYRATARGWESRR